MTKIADDFIPPRSIFVPQNTGGAFGFEVLDRAAHKIDSGGDFVGQSVSASQSEVGQGPPVSGAMVITSIMGTLVFDRIGDHQTECRRVENTQLIGNLEPHAFLEQNLHNFLDWMGINSALK